MELLAALQGGPFDTFTGLPVHVLALHGVVVGVPLMSLVTVAVAARPAWRARLGWLVAVANVLLLGLVWVTVQAGEALRERLGGQVAAQHAEYGARMTWFALGLVVAAAVSAVAGRRRGMGVLALVLAVVAAAAATYWVVITGHSGTTSHWGQIVESTNP